MKTVKKIFEKLFLQKIFLKTGNRKNKTGIRIIALVVRHKIENVNAKPVKIKFHQL